MRRKHGHANVEEHPKGSGLHRVRARIGKRLTTIASKLPKKVADETANAYGVLRAEGELREGITLAQFGTGFLDRRERRRVRGIKKDRNRWKTYIENDSIGGIALRSLRRPDVVEWRDRLIEKPLKAQTVRNALNLLRVALAQALDRELVNENVARDVKVGRVSTDESEDDLSGVLSVEEQEMLLAAVPAKYVPMVVFALFTGLRWAELSWLRWSDIKGDTMHVRTSTDGGPTKSGKLRKVPILPPAAEALEEIRKTVKKSCEWVFPSQFGKPRGYRPSKWQKWVTAAKIGRPIRWHDLRHTCATCLLAGSWGGERWTLDEVCQMLGHAHISTTERYAHKVDETLQNAAKKKFPGGNGNGPSGGKDSGVNAFVNRRSRVQISRVAPQESCGADDRVASGSGTLGEQIPKRLRRAISRTSAKTRDGVLVRRLAKATAAAMAGDKAGTVAELRAAAKGVR